MTKNKNETGGFAALFFCLFIFSKYLLILAGNHADCGKIIIVGISTSF